MGKCRNPRPWVSLQVTPPVRGLAQGPPAGRKSKFSLLLLMNFWNVGEVRSGRPRKTSLDVFGPKRSFYQSLGRGLGGRKSCAGGVRRGRSCTQGLRAVRTQEGVPKGLSSAKEDPQGAAVRPLSGCGRSQPPGAPGPTAGRFRGILRPKCSSMGCRSNAHLIRSAFPSAFVPGQPGRA